jgi:hypothetical protein
MPKAAARRLALLLLAGCLWSLGCQAAGVRFWSASRFSGIHEDLPPVVVTVVVVFTSASLWRQWHILLVLSLHGAITLGMFAASVFLAGAGRVPLAHTVMAAVLVAVLVDVARWRDCFDLSW